MLRLTGYWYIAAPSSALRRRPIRRVVENETLVLFRDSAGQAHALIDRCAHRGMALSMGKVRGDCIECPYHGWQYDGEGVLRHVPALCQDEWPPQPRSMRAFPVHESDEHIWIWIGDETPAETPFRFPHCGERGWTTFFMHTQFEAPVEACLENFLDVPHTLFVHPGLFRGKDRQPTRVHVRRLADGVVADFLDEQPLRGIGPRLVFPKNTVMKHSDRFILPAVTRVDYTFGPRHGFVITSQCTQREEYLVDVTTAITWRLPLPGWLLKPFLRWYCRRVIGQDVAVLKVLGRQLRDFGPTYASTAADVLGRHIRGLRRQTVEDPDRLAEEADAGAETVLFI
jgi:phenylpropionate dioxygenase-like ring-hydroxylating dioxygenase large terminal subunit